MMNKLNQNSTTRGIQFRVASALCLTLMLACVKGLDGTVPAGQIAFYRSSVMLLPMLAWIMWERRGAEVFRLSQLKRHLPRGVSGSIAMFLSFATLACLPLADAVLLGYAAPLIAVVLGRALLDERVPGYRWTAAIAGAAGVTVALLPHLDAWSRPVQFSAIGLLGIGAGLGAALFSALSTIQIRSLAVTEPPEAIVFYYTMTTGVLGAASICFGWVVPDMHQLMLLMLAGVFGGGANIFMAQSLRHAHVSVTAPFEYTTLAWSALLSWSMFDQVPGGPLLAGGAIVAASGLYAYWSESRATRDRPIIAAPAARPPSRTQFNAGQAICRQETSR